MNIYLLTLFDQKRPLGELLERLEEAILGSGEPHLTWARAYNRAKRHARDRRPPGAEAPDLLCEEIRDPHRRTWKLRDDATGVTYLIREFEIHLY